MIFAMRNEFVRTTMDLVNRYKSFNMLREFQWHYGLELQINPPWKLCFDPFRFVSALELMTIPLEL